MVSERVLTLCSRKGVGIGRERPHVRDGGSSNTRQDLD